MTYVPIEELKLACRWQTLDNSAARAGGPRLTQCVQHAGEADQDVEADMGGGVAVSGNR